MVSARRGSDAAFLLMDALLALTLITGILFASVVLFGKQVRAVRNTHERLAAMLIAESEIERLRTLPYERIETGAARPLSLALPSAARLKECSATLMVTELSPGLKRAEVRVQWSSPKGRPLGATMASEFAAEARGL